MNLRERKQNSGFTFIELVAVLTVLALVTAVVVPVFGASISAMKARSARGDFVALLYHAQELAVRESREVRLYLDLRNKAYWLEVWREGHGDEKIFQPREDRESGARRYFPDSIALADIHARTDRKRNLHYIAFHPGGASDRASIRLENRAADSADVTVTTTGILGGIEVAHAS